MNKNNSKETDINLKNFPDTLISIMNESSESGNSVKKLAAGRMLAGMGKHIIPKQLSSEIGSLRMGTAKIIELIACRRYFPFLIRLLSPDDAHEPGRNCPG